MPSRPPEESFKLNLILKHKDCNVQRQLRTNLILDGHRTGIV
eukprot:gene33220-40990_t